MMSFPSANLALDNPTVAHKPILTPRTASNFFVSPMGKGRHARLVEKNHEAEDDPMSGVGFSILGAVIGGALGLGPMFDIAFEALKSGIEIGENSVNAAGFAQDVNLNPAALLRPDLAFNFKTADQALNEKRMAVQPKLVDELDGKQKSRRSWDSGQMDYVLSGQLAALRRRNIASNPVLPMRGVGAPTLGGSKSSTTGSSAKR